MLLKGIGPSNGLAAAFPHTINRVPLTCGIVGANHPSEGSRHFGECLDGCLSRHGAPLCPFKCKLDCAAFRCNRVSLDTRAVPTKNSLSIALAVYGANSCSKARVIRLCVESLCTSSTHPIGRLGGCREMFLGTKRSGRMHFALARRSLGFCGTRLRCIYRPKRFRIVTNPGDESLRGGGFILLWEPPWVVFSTRLENMLPC